jgi:hypothetical protein
MKTCLVVGSAENVWIDLYKARGMFPTADIMAVNLMMMCFRKSYERGINVQHWACINPHFFYLAPIYCVPKSVEMHYAQKDDYTASFSNEGRITVPRAPEGAKWWDLGTSGCSGFFATQVASKLYEQVILCGIPMDSRPHLYDMPGVKCEMFEDELVLKPWRDAKLPNVRSMSGKTKAILGGL